MGVESKGPQNKRKPHIKDVWGQLHIMTWYSISKTCLAIRKKKKTGMNFVKISTFWPYSRNAKTEFPKKKPENFKVYP